MASPVKVVVPAAPFTNITLAVVDGPLLDFLQFENDSVINVATLSIHIFFIKNYLVNSNVSKNRAIEVFYPGY